MIVTVKPPGREEYALSVESPPQFSASNEYGYEAALIDCELDDRQRLYALGARLRIHGTDGIAWQGIVTRRPGRGEPLEAQGWGWCTTFGRRAALYCDTSLADWQDTNESGAAAQWTTGTGTASLVVSIPAGTWASGAYRRWRKEVPASASVRITGTIAFPDAKVEMHIHKEDGTTDYVTKLSSSGAFDVTATGTAIVAIRFTPRVVTGQTYSPATDAQVTITDLKVYGVAGVTSPTVGNVLADVLDAEVDTDYLPAGAAYRAFIAADTTAVEPLVFDARTSAADKVSELRKYSAGRYGWYMEMIAGQPYCVPHWEAVPTSPEYVLDLTRAESYDLDESGLDELVSAVRVNYQTTEGRSTYTDVTDTDTSHPLVAAGITRYGEISVQTASSTTATTTGELYLAENGREQVKGTVTTRLLRDSNGNAAYLPSVRAGSVVRVMGLPQGSVDCILKRITCTGDTTATLELDNAPYRLDILLARLNGLRQR